MAKVVSVSLDAEKVARALEGSSREMTCSGVVDLGSALTSVDEAVPDLLVFGGDAAAAAELAEELIDEPSLLGTPMIGWSLEGDVAGMSRVLALGVQVVAGDALAFRTACEEALDARDGRTRRVEPGTELRALAGDEPDLHGRRVLVADDDPAIAWYFADVLRARGCDVDEATDGESALDRARRTVPDLIVSDIRMPRLDGLRLCRALRADPILADVPVILLSWKEDWLQRAEREGIGASAYLAKRSTPEQVLECVQQVLVPHARLDRRLRSSGAVRGRLDGTAPYRLLRLACAARPDARLTLQCHPRAYEVRIRDGAPRSATCASRDGGVLRGTPAIVSLLGERAGRFTLDVEQSRIEPELSGSLHQQIAGCVARAREGVLRVAVAPVAGPTSEPAPMSAPGPAPALAPIAFRPPSPPLAYVPAVAPPAVRTVPLPPQAFFLPRTVTVTPRTTDRTLPLARPAAPSPRAVSRPVPPLARRAWRGSILRYAGVAIVAALGILFGAGVHVLRQPAEAPAPHPIAAHPR